MYKTLRDHGVNITIKDQNSNAWLGFLIQLAPFALLLGLWFFLLRQMQSGGNKAMSFGKSRARLLSMQQKKITFKDVAGVDEAKEELKEIIEFLREAQKFQRLGGRIPKGVLLVGPPGTGKTLLARAVAGEANVPFFSISGSDFVEMFVGVGASPRPRPLRAGQEERPLHHLHRRDRRRRSSPWRRPRRRTRRARADPQPAPRRDGRLRVQRRRHPRRRDQPPRRSRPRASPPRPLRSPRHRRSPRHPWPRRGSQGPLQEGPHGRRRRPQHPRSWHTGLLRRRPRQHGQRGRPHRRPLQPQVGPHVRLRSSQGQGHDGRRAQVDAPHRRREARHRLSRGRSHPRLRPARALRPAPQGHHHPPRHGARRHRLPPRGRPAHRHQGLSRDPPRHPHGRTLRRRDLPQADDHRRRQRHRAHHRARPQDGLRVRHERTSVR